MPSSTSIPGPAFARAQTELSFATLQSGSGLRAHAQLAHFGTQLCLETSP